MSMSDGGKTAQDTLTTVSTEFFSDLLAAIAKSAQAMPELFKALQNAKNMPAATEIVEVNKCKKAIVATGNVLADTKAPINVRVNACVKFSQALQQVMETMQNIGTKRSSDVVKAGVTVMEPLKDFMAEHDAEIKLFVGFYSNPAMFGMMYSYKCLIEKRPVDPRELQDLIMAAASLKTAGSFVMDIRVVAMLTFIASMMAVHFSVMMKTQPSTSSKKKSGLSS